MVVGHPAHGPWPLLLTLAGVMAVWPLVATVSANEPDRQPQTVSVIRPPTASAGAWVATALSGAAQVAGLGGAVVVVDTDGIWPVRMLRDGQWRQLLGIPLGVSVADGVGTSVDDGFVVAGVEEGRSVLFRYNASGRFQGATTVFGVEAGVVIDVGGQTVVFDATRPEAVVVGSGLVALPGTVSDAAVGGGLTILTTDGEIHRAENLGEAWTPLGSGFVALVGEDPVYAVGSSASIGLVRVMRDGTLLTLERAPVGPTVTWGGSPAIYDWSTDSVWALSETGWGGISLWESDGFVGDFVGMIDGASIPSVVGVTERGLTVWQRSG